MMNMIKNAAEPYNRLVTEIEEEIRRLKDFYGDILQCRPDCDDCCTAFALLPLEAALLRLAYENLSDEEKCIVQQQIDRQAGQCPFLVQRQCCIYQSRPLICRTHGLPIAYINEELEAIEVSACPINFPADTGFEKKGLLFMDSFNAKLAELNQKYVGEKAMRPDSRIAMHKIITEGK